MMARDIMTTRVVAVRPDTPVREVARALLDHRISAVPVVDDAGRPIGIISEGDLVARSQGAREERRDWWISLLAEGEHLNEDFLAYARSDKRTAHQIMVAPVVTVSEDTSIDEIARILASYRIKRVPVLAHRRMVGIVSRADLVRALSEGQRVRPPRIGDEDALSALLVAESTPPAPAAPAAGDQPLSAHHFRELVADHELAEVHRRAEMHRIEAEKRHAIVSSLIVHHIGDDAWRALVQTACDAAAHGAKEHLLLRFPSDLCRDGGRAINAPEPNWPETLRGEAAEVYLRWERDLKPQGFGIAARVLDFPGGVPGDVGLFLTWGA